MGEKRNPDVKMLLEFGATKQKIEMFDAALWPNKYHGQKNTFSGKGAIKYRVRVNGKWFPRAGLEKCGKVWHQYTFFTKYEIRDMLWRGVKWDKD